MSAAAKDKLVFKSTSADKKPGKGIHESVADPSAYSDLARIKDFRRYLSNFDSSCSFKWQGPYDKEYTFRSVEHAFQGAKIYRVDPAAGLRFTMESGDPIGLGDGAVAQKHRKLVKLSGAQLAAWASVSSEVMASASKAKYSQNPDGVAAQILKATGEAELFHLVTQRGAASMLVRFTHLEEIRSTL
jgi:hypothetical protein